MALVAQIVHVEASVLNLNCFINSKKLLLCFSATETEAAFDRACVQTVVLVMLVVLNAVSHMSEFYLALSLCWTPKTVLATIQFGFFIQTRQIHSKLQFCPRKINCLPFGKDHYRLSHAKIKETFLKILCLLWLVFFMKVHNVDVSLCWTMHCQYPRVTCHWLHTRTQSGAHTHWL